MLLFNNVVEVFALADFYTAIILRIELITARFISTTFVDFD